MSSQVTMKRSRQKYHHSSVVLESRPLNIFKVKKHAKKQTEIKCKKVYEPMTDSQLAAALNLDVIEIAEAFGYTENDLENKFYDEEYALDTNGLELIDDGELGMLLDCNVAMSQNYLEDHNVQDIAAQHGYVDDATGTDSLDDGEIAAQFGYNDDDHSDTSVDDEALAAEFGYGDSVESNKEEDYIGSNVGTDESTDEADEYSSQDYSTEHSMSAEDSTESSGSDEENSSENSSADASSQHEDLSSSS